MKNDASRKSWLILQRMEDADLRATTEDREIRRRVADKAEESHERARSQYEGTRLEIQLARESLRFLSGGEV